jgi:hypothetical protein
MVQAQRQSERDPALVVHSATQPTNLEHGRASHQGFVETLTSSAVQGLWFKGLANGDSPDPSRHQKMSRPYAMTHALAAPPLGGTRAINVHRPNVERYTPSGPVDPGRHRHASRRPLMPMSGRVSALRARSENGC